MTSRIHWRSALASLALLASAACAGKGCSCIAPIKGGFPIADRHESAIQLRATAGLFSYLENNATTVLNGLLPGMGLFDVPPSCSGTNKICCGTPQPTCQIEIKPQALVAQPTPPNVLHVDLRTQLISQGQIPVEFDVTIGTAKCLVTIDTTKGTAGHSDIDVVTDVQFPVDATTDLTGLHAANTTINNLDPSMIDLQSQPGDFLCTLANIGIIKSFVIGQVQSQLTTQIADTIDKQTCMKCMDKSDCNAFAQACTMGECVNASGACIQEVGVDGRMDLSTLLAKFSPSTQGGLDVLAVLGGYAAGDTGLSLGMLGGGLGDPHNACVPVTPKPAAVTVPRSPTFTKDVLPDGTTPYHLGIGVHRSNLDQLGWGAFDGGALCLDIGSAQVAALTAQTLSVIIPSLQDLTHGDAPMLLVMRPHQPPTFTLGKGTFKMDMNGMKVIDDPLMVVHAPDFAIDFYAFVDERFVRVMTLGADLALPVSLDVDAMGQITPIVGDFAKAFTNVTVTNSDLLAESPADLAKTFPMLLGIAGGQISSVLKPIALPAVMGLNLKPISITSTDPDMQGHTQFLSIFTDLSTSKTQSQRVSTRAGMSALSLPPRERFAVDARDGSQPVVRLQVAGDASDPRALEFAWQLDGSGWSPWTPTGTLVVTHPLLWLPGAHRLEVRGRAVGLPDTADPSPVVLDLSIDPSAATAATPVRASGCQVGVGSAPTGNGLLVACAILGVLLIARRRLRIAALSLVLFTGCHAGSPGQGDFENPVDEVGRYSDVVVQGGVFHISAYDDTMGDLTYAQITADQTAQPITWQVIDGIDPTAPSDSPTPYRHGVSDPGPDVGLYTSIALSGGGDPRISYYDVTDSAVKLALGPYPFRTITVDSSPGAGVLVGLYTALTLDSSGVPSIAYLATGISDGQGGFRSELRLAVGKSASPGDGEFTITTVDTARISCAGRCADGQACIQAAMVNGQPNTDPSQSSCMPTSTCASACATGQACIGGTCTAELAAPKVVGLVEGVGLFTRARMVGGALTLLYYDHAHGGLKLARQNPDGSFSVSLVDGNAASTDVGQHCTFDAAADGTLHIAYQDALGGRLLYQAVQGGAAATPEVVDDGQRDDGKHPVGAGASLLLVGGAPTIVYQDQQLSDLDSASRGAAWTHQPLDSGVPGYGFFPHLVSDGTKVWLSQFVYDRENGGSPLGALQISPMP
jgi:hypothetical protein